MTKHEKLTENCDGNILVMDDEAALRDISVEFLSKLGYQVTTAGDGDEAIKKYRKAKQEKHPFDAVIIDLNVPGGMGGRETISKLRKLNPKIKAIVSSGEVDNPVMANYKDFGFSASIAKPFHLNDLNQALDQLVLGSDSLHGSILTRMLNLLRESLKKNKC